MKDYYGVDDIEKLIHLDKLAYEKERNWYDYKTKFRTITFTIPLKTYFFNWRRVREEGERLFWKLLKKRT